MRSNQTLLSGFGTTLFLCLPSVFSSSPTGTFRSHQLKQHGHIFKKVNGKNECGYICEDVGEENPNCPFKCVPSRGVKVRGNGHLKSQPGRGLH